MNAALLEAAIAALFLEHGYEPIAPAIVAAFSDRIEYARTTHVDHKTELQEALAKTGRSVSYVVVDVDGPAHERHFSCAAQIDGEELGAGHRPHEEGSRAGSRQAGARRNRRLILILLDDARIGLPTDANWHRIGQCPMCIEERLRESTQAGSMAWGRHRQLLAQETTVYSLRRRAWGGPQLVAQAPSQRLVHEQRLRRVASRLERLHQQPVPALAVGRALDQLASRSLCRVELAAADRDAGAADELE